MLNFYKDLLNSIIIRMNSQQRVNLLSYFGSGKILKEGFNFILQKFLVIKFLLKPYLFLILHKRWLEQN